MTSNDRLSYLSIENVIKEMVAMIGVDETCRVLVQIEGLEDCDLPSSVQQFLTDTAALQKEKRSSSYPCCYLKYH